MTENSWLDAEMFEVDHELRLKPHFTPLTRRRDMVKIAIIFIALLLCFTQAYCQEELIYDESGYVVGSVEKGVFFHTWTCPKDGYENMDGCNSCCLCGTKRPANSYRR